MQKQGAIGESAEGRDDSAAIAPTASSTWTSITQDVLFASEEDRCDACGAEVEDDDDATGFPVPGRGVYMWSRGDDVRFDSVPLCPSCAAAIGMTALARWEIEEEEG